MLLLAACPGASITRLLQPCGPATVAGPVVAVVVDAVDGVSPGWPRPHVLVERREALAPSRADLNSSAAVVAISGCQWISTSPKHGVPARVFGEVPAFAGAAVDEPVLASPKRAAACLRRTLVRDLVDASREPASATATENVPAAERRRVGETQHADALELATDPVSRRGTVSHADRLS